MFIDIATIYCKAGDGGNGYVGFHREKFVSKGGPDGGDGGKGGDIYFQADASINTLLNFRYNQHFLAGDGEHGKGNKMTGKNGSDIVIKVPQGTVVKDANSGSIIADVFNNNEKILVLKGAKGGRGNARFATPTRRAPAFAENGNTTQKRKLLLELKTIADIGIIGYPNVGKSTLLSIISAARPKIANYPFTTLSPNLGVVQYYENTFTVADIPGLIERASEGVGLGHSFLRHIERVRLIVHIVDISGSEGRNPIEDYRIIRNELKNYSKDLYNLSEIIVLNKIDLVQDEELIKNFQKMITDEVTKENGKEDNYKPIMQISAITNTGIRELVAEMSTELKKLPPIEPIQFVPFEYEEEDKYAYEIKVKDGIFYVTGGFVQELARKVYLDDTESFVYFQRQMRERGIIDDLRKQGAKDGDTICVLDVEFELID